MNKDYILFDLDGTLTDSGPGIMKSVRGALEYVGARIGDPSELRRFVGPPLEYSFQTFYNLDDETTARAVKRYRETYERDIFINSVYAGITETLQALKDAGKKLIVATSKPSITARIVLDHFDLAKYFAMLSGSGSNGERGSKSEVIQYALNNASARGVDKQSAVMVGDREYDVKGAEICGIPCVGVTWGYGTADELKRAGAAAVINKPAELLKIVC